MRDTFNASEWLVDRHVDAGNGYRIAIRSGDETFDYAEVQRRVGVVAGALRALGVRPEERVAMAMLDSIEFVSVFLGAMRIGAIPVPMNPAVPISMLRRETASLVVFASLMIYLCQKECADMTHTS